MSLELEIHGLEEAQAAIDEIDPEEILESILDRLIALGVVTAAQLTPVKTGSMKRSWMKKRTGLNAQVSIDPLSRNTATGGLVSDYAGEVNERLGILDSTAQEIQSTDIEKMVEIP